MPTLRTALLALLLTAAALPAQQPNARTAVRDFDAYVAKGVRDWDVPGLSIAVVRNDSVLMARGYGVRALGAPGAVDEHTLFGIMSTTKAFTAAAIAILVDERKLAWNDPVSKWLPELQLADSFVTRELTVRDLLTHSTGLGNADLLWTRGDLDQGEIFRRLRYLRPAYSLRSSFIYQNVMYGAAGEVVARASGMSWADFVRTRFFQPLGMTRTLATYADVRASNDRNVSLPHYRIRDTIRVIEEEPVDLMPAAGSIWSTAHDMTKWARFLLDSARIDGKRLISSQGYAELFRPQVLVPQSEFYPTAARTRPRWMSYGLGWFQQDYNGRYIAYHTGSLAGRTAIVALVPDARMAVIVFGNVDHAELRHALMLRAIDVFAGTNGAPMRDWSAELLALYGAQRQRADSLARVQDSRRKRDTRPSLPVAAYAGTYEHPGWGTIVIAERDGRLHGSWGVSSQNAGWLEHWQDDIFRATLGDGRGRPVALHFVPGADGKAERVSLGGSPGHVFVRVR